MAALPYMQLYVADYLADTPHLTTEEHGAYLLLIFNYWQTGRPLPKSRLAGIAKLSNERWTDVERSLNEFFLDTGSEWVHERIERDLEVVKSAQTQRVAAGNASAAKRALEKALKNQMASDLRSTTVQRKSNDRLTNKDKETDKEKERSKDKTLLPVAEKDQPPAESEFIRLPLNDGSEFMVTEPLIAEWESLYPAVDVRQELRNQRGWLLAEPRRRKTQRGVNKFINTWLQKRQDNPTAASRQVNHAKTTANANGNSSESRAMQKFHAAARERLGENFMEILGSDDRNILRSVDSEERSGTIIPLGNGDWDTV